MASKKVDSIERFEERWNENIETIREKDQLDRKACKNIYSDFRADAEDILIFSEDFDRSVEIVKDYNSKLTIALDSSRTNHKLNIVELISDIKLEIILLKNKFF